MAYVDVYCNHLVEATTICSPKYARGGGQTCTPKKGKKLQTYRDKDRGQEQADGVDEASAVQSNL